MNVTRAHLHAMTLEVVAKRGNTNPTPSAEANALIFELKVNIDALKKGVATEKTLRSICERLLVASWAARDVNVGDGADLVKQRQLACDNAFDLLTAMIDDKRYVAKGAELKALDRAYTAVIELYDNLPEWCFLQASLDLIKLSLGRHRKTRKGKRK